MNISLAIPFYNNSKFIRETLLYPISDDRISEIIICDDNSDDKEKLEVILEELKCPKIKLIKNHTNIGVYLNKLETLRNCSNEWAILFDSDNILSRDYVDKIYHEKWEENVIISPSLVEKINGMSERMDTIFDYRMFIGDIEIANFFEKREINEVQFDTLLNTCNYFVPVKNFLKCMEREMCHYNTFEISSLDSLTFFTDWVANGQKFKILAGLEYKHRIHWDSTYTKTSHRLDQSAWTERQFEKIKNKMV